ncbi:MAG: sulfotransferase [Candidatus Methanomethylicaceae archaeon]
MRCYAFIIGSPRSGTTILGQILGLHPRIAQWYEPYFVWDRYFRSAPDDYRDRSHATPQVVQYIRKAFNEYRSALRADIVVDKSPRNCLKMEFLEAIFPDAKFIFLYRDGRDTVLSIYREWLRRKRLLEETKGWRGAGQLINTIKEWLARQPLWRHRWQAFLFEAGPPWKWMQGRFLHRERWNGRIGWGPRFPGWEELIGHCSLLEFAAHQWARCVGSFLPYAERLSNSSALIVRYEDFVQDPKTELQRMLDFLGVAMPDNFMKLVPPIKSNNYGKWLRELTHEELHTIEPIISSSLVRMGYKSTSH